ncbi:formylglycine-generating enzyme family protein [candidate division KSB1 bacterium]
MNKKVINLAGILIVFISLLPVRDPSFAQSDIFRAAPGNALSASSEKAKEAYIADEKDKELYETAMGHLKNMKAFDAMIAFDKLSNLYASSKYVKYAEDYLSEMNLEDIKEIAGEIERNMALIQPGEFMMGSMDGRSVEKPVHLVKLDEFYINKYEVTQREWQAIMGNNRSNFKGDNRPAEKVNWSDQEEFFRRLTAISGKKYRLPTEAEWEYACRAGSSTKYCFGDSESQLGEYAWYSSNSESTTHDVGQKKPNAWDLYDMHGNVWEWCSDWYGSYSPAPVDNPEGPASGQHRVLRGGSYHYPGDLSRSAYRNYCRLDHRNDTIGFRCARDR